MNYFEFYNMPVAFIIDEGLLRRQFLLKSKEYHPDFYTMESDEKQAEILELSSINNKAYKTLSDFNKRMEYILHIKNILNEKVKPQLPQSFLMEMMDINEEVMELQFDFNEEKFQKILKIVQEKEDSMQQAIDPILNNYKDEEDNLEDLKKVRDFVLEKRYFVRLRENIAKLKA